MKAEVKDSGDTLLAGVGLNYRMGKENGLATRLGYDYHYYETSNIITSEDSKSNSLELVSLNVILYIR